MEFLKPTCKFGCPPHLYKISKFPLKAGNDMSSDQLHEYWAYTVYTWTTVAFKVGKEKMIIGDRVAHNWMAGIPVKKE